MIGVVAARRPMALSAVGACAGSLFVLVATRISPLVGAGALAAIAAAIAMTVEPWIGFFVTCAVVPLERIGRISSDASTVGFSLMRLVGLGTLACFLLQHLLRRGRLLVPAPLLIYAAYVTVGGLTLAHTSDWEYGVRTMGALLGNVLFFFLAINLVRTPERARVAVIVWLTATTAIGLFTIYQWHNPAAVVSEDPFNSTGERSNDERFATVLADTSEYELLDHTPRALGSTSHPAVYGINLILTIPFWAYLWRTTRGRQLRLVVAAGAAVTAYNVVLSNTRAAVITLVLTIAITAATRLLRVTAATVSAAVLASALALPFLPSALYDRIFDFSKYTTDRSDTLKARFTYWGEGLNIFTDHWFAGAGIGNQTELPRRLSRRMYMPPNSTVHNEYLQSLLETGLLGYPLLIAFMVVLYRWCRFGERRADADGDDESRWLFTACRVSLIAVLFYGTQVDVLHFPLKGWWLAMGIAVALAARPSRTALE